MLRISVLGAPQIEIDGQRIATFESRTADALLYYLAVNDRTHTRESLAEFFWPERTQIQSLSNLRTVLHRLRRVLEPHLQITRSTVKLENQAGVWIDAAHLLEVLNEIDVNALVATTAARLNEALVHYRGPMLDGFFLRDCPDFEDWLRRTRETWQIRMVDALDALTAYYLQNEMVVPAMTQVERLIQTDPLREQSYGLKMRLLSGMGQQDKAMDLYRSFEAILHSELDDVPSPELQRLFRQIHASQSTHNGIQRLTLNLAAMTQHWLDADRHRDYLATGKVLQHLETLLDGRVGLSELEREFINASLKIRERLLTEEQTKQNRENALRLVLEATQILDRGGTGELAALLAIQSLELSYTASGDAALLRALQKPLLRQRFSGHNFRTIYITASADGRYLLTAGADKTVRLWETHTGANLRVISDFDVTVRSLVFSPDSLHYAAGGVGHLLRVWAVDREMPVRTLTGHYARVQCVAWSHDGELLASGDAEGCVHIWHANSGDIAGAFYHDASVEQVYFSLDQSILYTVTTHTITLWNVTTANRIQVIETGDQHITATALLFSRNHCSSGHTRGAYNVGIVRPGK